MQASTPRWTFTLATTTLKQKQADSRLSSEKAWSCRSATALARTSNCRLVVSRKWSRWKPTPLPCRRILAKSVTSSPVSRCRASQSMAAAFTSWPLSRPELPARLTLLLPTLRLAAALASNSAALRQNHNLYLLDGGENSDRGGAGGMSIAPSLDSIAEFRQLTSNYSADYGLSSGGTMTMVLKSGTKQFHAAAWEFNRNDAFDARTYNNRAPNPVAELRQNTFGFNVGGPVTFGKLYNPDKNKTFFFYNMEWRKYINGGTLQTVVPAIMALAVTGTRGTISSSSTTRPCRPTASVVDSSVLFANCPGQTAPAGESPGSPFPGNQIPSCMISPNAHGSAERRWQVRRHLPGSDRSRPRKSDVLWRQQFSNEPARRDCPHRSQLQQQVLGVRTFRRRIGGADVRYQLVEHFQHSGTGHELWQPVLQRRHSHDLCHQPHAAERGLLQLQRQPDQHYSDWFDFCAPSDFTFHRLFTGPEQ